jgi:hypothetical protein
LRLARQRLIDETFELAFEGAVERIYRDGKLVQEKRWASCFACSYRAPAASKSNTICAG